jgi:hypothetical protein
MILKIHPSETIIIESEGKYPNVLKVWVTDDGTICYRGGER